MHLPVPDSSSHMTHLTVICISPQVAAASTMRTSAHDHTVTTMRNPYCSLHKTLNSRRQAARAKSEKVVLSVVRCTMSCTLPYDCQNSIGYAPYSTRHAQHPGGAGVTTDVSLHTQGTRQGDRWRGHVGRAPRACRVTPTPGEMPRPVARPQLPRGLAPPVLPVERVGAPSPRAATRRA